MAAPSRGKVALCAYGDHVYSASESTGRRGDAAADSGLSSVAQSWLFLVSSSSDRPPFNRSCSWIDRLKSLSWMLAPPVILAVGMSVFTQSFFLSRTPFDHRSSCGVDSAGDLLEGALGLREEDVRFLRSEGILSDRNTPDGEEAGCWVPRRVDSMAILVVDALRFDFARDHLPLSIGSRLFPSHNSTHPNEWAGASKLFQFVADPPTVTMQRLKGMTTGGLPTFADITGSFGGASIGEDSWVGQLKDAPWRRRRIHSKFHEREVSERERTRPKIAFVGDDTWVDLFPTQFDDCHPYPSFNTRDLDTVDNGCLKHLPRLLEGMVGLMQEEQQEEKQEEKPVGYQAGVGNFTSASFELIVAHFLGVDHVGHTYGPNNLHMEGKLHQMDLMLSTTLSAIDASPKDSCIVALVFGDHGMTEDGNHGGGTSEEVNAGLFVHFSHGCLIDEHQDQVTGEGIPGSARAFDSIHQIDLVPTISLLLGLPIPYANIGGLVPNLLPAPRDQDDQPSYSSSTPHTVTALALNAAQVWNYLHTYSKQSRDLPPDRLGELKGLLDGATVVYRDAISHSRKQLNSKDEGEENFFDSSAYRQACGLFKLFLAESTDLGKQVWTQFNERGMMTGITILFGVWVMAVPLWKRSFRNEIGGMIISCSRSAYHAKGNIKGNIKDENRSFHRLEVLAALMFMFFQCGVLTFGNSYIEHEREIITFFLSVLCLLVFRRWYLVPSVQTPTPLGTSVYLPLIVALCSRMNDVFVTGHGLDPSLHIHWAHHPFVFLTSLALLVLLCLRWVIPASENSGSERMTSIPLSAAVDVLAMIFLAASWVEKRALDHSRNGFTMARYAMLTASIGMAHSLFLLAIKWNLWSDSGRRHSGGNLIDMLQVALFRAMLFLIIVTGPSAASTAVLIVIQCAALRLMMESHGPKEVGAPVMAAIWRLSIRHVFFATNHHCSFNRLQYSAAFIATDTFQFYIAGSSLFVNTFGWEMIGSALVLLYSQSWSHSTSLKIRSATGIHVWEWFRYFQCTEMLASCISVSVMKRHLMVWAVFAPRFMFALVFTVVGLTLWALDVFVMVGMFSPFATGAHENKQDSP